MSGHQRTTISSSSDVRQLRHAAPPSPFIDSTTDLIGALNATATHSLKSAVNSVELSASARPFARDTREALLLLEHDVLDQWRGAMHDGASARTGELVEIGHVVRDALRHNVFP